METITAAIDASLELGPVDQIGFVVKDLDKAIEIYRPLFGEFERMSAHDMEWQYYGDLETSSINIAFAKSGDVEIELIEWLCGKTPHKEFLDAGHEGMHHLRFMVDNCEAAVEKANRAGYQTSWYKRFDPKMAAAYVKRDDDPLYLEFFENHHG